MRRRLKRFMSLFFVALLMIPPGLIPAVAKAETNEGDEPGEVLYHDFEGDSTEGWFNLNWDDMATADIEITDEAFSNGEQSLGYLNRPADIESRLAYNLGEELTPGEIYTISFDVKLKEDNDIFVFASKYSYPNTTNEYPWLSGEIEVGSDEWTSYTLENFEYHHGATELIVFLQTQNTQNDFYLDNFKVIHVGTMDEPEDEDRDEIPEDERVAAFTDFEDGTTQGWVARGENEELTVVEGTAKNGNHSLLVENRKASSDAAMIEFLGKMHPGNEYKFSLWMKLADGEEDTALQLSAAETVNGETSYYPPVIEPKIVTADEWVLLEGTYDVPSAIEELFFYVEEEYDEDSDSGVSYYIDDFKAEEFVPESSIQDLTPLKDIYKDYFYIGNAVESVHFSGRTLELLTKHHNLVTAENIMKPENYYSNGEFNSSGPDRFLRNAVDNGLEIHGHVLLWHSQSEDSLYKNSDGSYKSSEEALANMHEHIEKVMTSAHAIAGDSIISWDVVNEALDGNWSNPEDWESILRPASGWLQAIGPDYMYEAFLKARQVADDLGQYDMILYYNDYNDHVQPKAQTMYHMVKDINERYAEQYPDDSRKLISGVGMQAHYTTSVNVENVRASLERFISLGVEVGVTELDVGASEGSTLTEEEELQQAYFYAQLFSLYKEHSDHMSRVTLWGLSDGNSWRSENNPLLFDRNLQAKLAYHALIDPDKFIEENGPDEVVARAGNAAYGSPTIDGKIDELWSDAPVLPINRFQTAHNGATGEARVLWDNENLYVLVEVNDNELDKTGTDAHEQDSVEVFIDEQNTKAASYGEGHGQYRVNFDNEQSFNPGDISEGFESRTVVNGTNYLVEMKIPFKTTEVEDGNTIGFDVQINDAVNGNRNSVAIWNDASGMGWSDPSVFGNLTLAKSTIDPDPKPDPKPDPGPKPETSVIVKPAVVDKQAKVADKDVEKVVKNGDLIVDISDNDSSIKVLFTKEQIKTLKKQNATIIVKKKDVEVQIPASILTNGNEAVEIEIEKMKDIDGALSAIYDFRILQGGKEIKEFDSHVTLTFEVDQDKVENSENVKVFYWNPDTEEWELVGGAYADGYISVDVDHFSIFAVFETEPGEVPVTEVPEIEDELETEVPEIVEDPKTEVSVEDNETQGEKLPKTATNTFNWLMIGLIMLLLGTGYIFISKRKRA